MGQKVNPHGIRVGIIKDWDSRWYSNKGSFGDTLIEDFQIRKYFESKTYRSEKSPIPLKPGISLVEIERDATKVKVFVHTAKPGILIGSKGAEIERMKKDLEKITKGKPINLNIIEIRDLDLNAQLVAESIAQQLEQRVSFRRAMKQVIGRTMRAGAKGIKTMVSGRLGGAEIARAESYKEGTIPLQTLRADIDYGTARANTTYGVIGVKVWIYKGEVLKGEVGAAKKRMEAMKREPNRKPRGEKRFDGRSNDRFRGDRPANREGRVNNASDRPGGRTDGGRTGGGNQGTQRTQGAPRAPRTEVKKEGGN
ncbi:MAG: 30S ribosomal protein S3 [Oscillospiraceae bacterium]|nr:30S ribosomal protein S3 [Oscillospiraceae bacterium]